jgi:glutathione S-transferase
LGDGPYLAGATFTLADIAITTALGIRQGALGQATPAKLAAYRERLMERPAYQRAKAKAQG